MNQWTNYKAFYSTATATPSLLTTENNLKKIYQIGNIIPNCRLGVSKSKFPNWVKYLQSSILKNIEIVKNSHCLRNIKILNTAIKQSHTPFVQE